METDTTADARLLWCARTGCLDYHKISDGGRWSASYSDAAVRTATDIAFEADHEAGFFAVMHVPQGDEQRRDTALQAAVERDRPGVARAVVRYWDRFGRSGGSEARAVRDALGVAGPRVAQAIAGALRECSGRLQALSGEPPAKRQRAR